MNSGSLFEDKKTALALFLCFMIVMVYSEYVITPALKPRPAQPTETSSTTQKEIAAPKLPPLPTTSEAETKTAALEKGTTASNTLPSAEQANPSEQELLSAGVITIDTPLYKTTISKLGGRMLEFQLKGYKRELDSEENFNFIRHQKNAPFPLALSLGGASDSRLLYTLSGATSGVTRSGDTFTLNKKEELRIKLSGTTSPLEKSIVFRGNSYLVQLTANSEVPAADGSDMELTWIKWIPEQETSSRYNPVNFSLLTTKEELEHILVTTPEDGPPQETAAKWLSIGDKYFMASLIADETGAKAKWSKEEDLYTITLQGSDTSLSARMYLGPKSYLILEKLGNELHRNVDLGFFSFLALPLLSCVYFFYGILGNYGLAIILLTLAIKTLFLPLTQASFKSMKAMQELQPEMKALRERVSDPTQLNQEMMALYKKRGVNPMGGCLPMIVQIPVFFGLYSALLNATELRHAPFALWINDLSAPEALSVAGIGIPVMLLLMGISMFFQQLLTPSAMDPQQKKIMLFMPVVLTVMFIIIPFPSGLVLYWLVNNLISIVQQAYIRKEGGMGPAKATVLASIAIFAFGWFVTVI